MPAQGKALETALYFELSQVVKQKGTMTTQIGGPSSGGGGDYGGVGAEMAGRFGPPPAFLTKTFQIVNDHNTNSIISWGESGESFIIWDHIKFTVEILPNYFRHNNFSSFVYQLNNYGFRKIGVDHQWEYANKDFQKGKQHLLSNMRRRSLQAPTRQRHRRSLCPEKLSSAIDGLKKEIDKMKMKQSDVDSQIMALQQQTNNFDTVSKKLIVQWAKAVQIIAKRARESPHCVDDDHDVEGRAGKREKVVVVSDDDEGHVAMREKVAVVSDDDHEKVAVVSVEIASESDENKDEEDHQNEMVKENEDDHARKSKPAEIDGKYSNDLSWMKNHFEEDDEVCEVESETSNLHAKIAKDFEELLTDQADAYHFGLEMKIGFTELLTQADADYSLEMKME